MALQFGDPTAIRLRDTRINARERQLRLPTPPFESKTFAPMTERELEAAAALSRCKFGVGTWDKSFVRSLETLTRTNPRLTDKMRWHMWRLVYRYRRQIHNAGLIQEATRHLGVA